MPRRRLLASVGLITVLLLWCDFAAAAGVDRSELLASMCVTCHGPDGKGSKKVPKLKGLEVRDIVQSMKGFQTGEESSTIMDRHANGYTDAEIRLMAEYFSALK